MSIKLGPIVGSTTHDEVKIWVQTHEPLALECRVYLDAEGNEQVPNSPFCFTTEAADGSAGTVTAAIPHDDKRYYYRIFERKDGSSAPISPIHSFRAFPDFDKQIESFSFALVSCNKPKNFNDRKELSYRNMWRNLYLEMSSQNAAFLLMVGDQVYADHKKFNAWKKSLKGVSRESALELYREVYFKHWKYPEMKMTLSSFPTFMIWDDHEITNGWGSSCEHGNNRYQEIFDASRKVYEEFKHCHNPEPLPRPVEGSSESAHRPYYYAFRYGSVAFLVLDLRGNRKIWDKDQDKKLLGREQWAALRQWFESKEAKDSKILFLVSSVPMIHIKMMLAKILQWVRTDIADQ